MESRRSEASRPRASAPDPTATAAYAAEVSAALRRLRHYPAAARDTGITGTVTVTFIIGPGGRVATHAIARSSGHPVLDQAARAILGNLALRPPPAGLFRATVPIRFELTR
ncbi:TonB family protein [Prosthecodimorpha hirschii]|uniref:TonB family protein n=1 Tax=Prosthecodimorpha hirschii TaxID=665126 RepID=UPI0015E32F52|nr:TonB family protein [Prosthecomicrobium hirschii]